MIAFSTVILCCQPVATVLLPIARFAAVSWLAQAGNYGVFAASLLVRPATPPV